MTSGENTEQEIQKDIESRSLIPPSVLFELLSSKPDDLLVTGSVAFGLQTGMSLREAIGSAADVDLLCLGKLEEKERHSVRKKAEKLSKKYGQEINIVNEDTHTKLATLKTENLKTEVGNVQVVDVESMALWDIANLEQIANPTYAASLPEYLRKKIHRLEQKLPYLKEESRVRAKDIVKKSKLLLENSD